MTVHDSHVHVGQFENMYFSPQDVVDFMDKVHVDKFAVSSTTVCNEEHEKSISEIKELTEIASDRVIPIIWVTPRMLRENLLSVYTTSGINWRCVKVHGLQNWTFSEIETVADSAHKMKLPLLLHTGGAPQCDAGQYYSLCKENKNQKIILAHSRPCDETINIMLDCQNAWADTAFTPITDIIKMIEAGLDERILWGSDYPIPHRFYPRRNILKMYGTKVIKLKQLLPQDSFEKIMFKNFETMFSKQIVTNIQN